MVIVGVLLLVIAAVVLVDMGVASSGTTDVRLLGWHLGTTGPGWFLLLGTAIGIVLTLGLTLVLSGQLRSRRKRRDRDRTLQGTRAENERLAAALDEQRAVVVPAATPAPVTDEHRHHLRRHDQGDHPLTDDGRPISSGTVDDHPAEAYPEGAEYVLGSRYPQATTAAHTPPAPPQPRDS